MKKSETKIVGLTNSEAIEKLQRFGPNVILKPMEIKFFDIFKEEMTEPMILLLLVVGFFYALWGSFGDTLAIFVIITFLVLAEVINEYRAKKAISSLTKITAPKTKVWRENQIVEIKSSEVVPGDILVLSPGTRVAADGELLKAVSLEVDESDLTGESFPQEKNTSEEIYAGSLILAGEGMARVATTGKNTRIGKISLLAETIKEPKTPLQLAMKTLASKLVFIALFFSLVIPLLGILRGQDLEQMILTGLALAFAVIPEELPIIVTMVLGLGAYQLSQKNFLIKKIKATETLGNATVILSDKTGTITENKMKVVYLYPANKKSEILETAINALTDISISPTDQAILEKAKELSLDINRFGKIIRERTIDSNKKTHAVLAEIDNHFELYEIGAPEEILEMAKNKTRIIDKEIENEARKGRRLIAVAKKSVSSKEKNLSFEKLEKNLNFVGLISIEDSPRPEVKSMIKLALDAGIKTIMATGDHPQTAAFIAKEVGIPSEKVMTGDEIYKLSDDQLKEAAKEVSVFARIRAEEKYRLVKAFQANGEIVAVTGDGVNDSLALKAADVGIAMGIKGTDAAKEAADIILADDNFATIAYAIFEGRKFFSNLKKGVKYYLSVKLALVSIFSLAVLLKLPFPFAPIQIIVLELFMDLAASVGFISELPEKSIFKKSFLELSNKFFDRLTVKRIAYSALSLFGAVSFIYLWALSVGLKVVEAQSLAFSTWVIGQILLAYISRSDYESIFELGFFSNKAINLWTVGALLFLAVINSSSEISAYLRLTPLNFLQLIIITIVAFFAIFWQEISKFKPALEKEQFYHPAQLE